MTIMEIVLLVIGIVVFVASFRIPIGKEETLSADQLKATEEEIGKLVKQKTDEAAAQLSDHMDETVTYAVEKAERSLDRLTNEKIMAVNEYADTVLSDIHKNHEEVVFLYDMLNDKQTHLKNTVREAEQTAKSVTKQVKETKEEALKPETQKAETQRTETQRTETQKNETLQADKPARRSKAPETSEQEKSGRFQPFVIPQVKVEGNNVKEAGEGVRKTSRRKTTMPELLNTDSMNDDSTDRNSKEAILRLHKAGKSNMAIARELGLGVGEVKLVIDLFKGM